MVLMCIHPIMRKNQVGMDSIDRKSTRLNSSHSQISYAVFCLKKKKKHRVYSRVVHRRQHRNNEVVGPSSDDVGEQDAKRKERHAPGVATLHSVETDRTPYASH